MSILNMQLPMEQAAEERWLWRYLDGELSAADAVAFEIYSLDKPHLIAALDADQRLRQAFSPRSRSKLAFGAGVMLDHSAADAAAAPAAGVRATPRAESAPRSRQRRFDPRWAAAACLLVGLCIGTLGGRWQGASVPIASVVANPMRIVYDVMRGAEQAPQIEHADSSSAYVVIDVALPAGATRIRLSGGDRAEQELHLSADGFVSFLGMRKDVGGRDYVIRYAQAGVERERRVSVPAVNMADRRS